MNTDHVLQRTRGKEILLLQAKDLSSYSLIVRIQNFADGLRGDLFVNSVVIVAFVECLEIERVDGLRRPEPQEVRHLGAITGNGDVVRNAFYDVLWYPTHTELAVLIVILLRMTTGAYKVCDLRP